MGLYQPKDAVPFWGLAPDDENGSGSCGRVPFYIRV